jgi:exopolysaccharide biosynthesis WecB/TagA/CpsF family protein
MKKVWLWGIQYSATDYTGALEKIMQEAKSGNHFGVSALAVHGLIEGYKNPELAKKINSIDLVVPDGQPIRWAMNVFHYTKLKDRVYGPTLMLRVLEAAEKEQIGIYLYGSTFETITKLKTNLQKRFTKLSINGLQADRFRDSTDEEKLEDINKINESGAKIVFIGRGCPRQEKWVAEHKEDIDAVLIAVGAAFDFHAGILPQAPRWMQKNGLEWLFRLTKEPKRLWKRYLLTNSIFMMLFLVKWVQKIFKA